MSSLFLCSTRRRFRRRRGAVFEAHANRTTPSCGDAFVCSFPFTYCRRSSRSTHSSRIIMYHQIYHDAFLDPKLSNKKLQKINPLLLNSSKLHFFPPVFYCSLFSKEEKKGTPSKNTTKLFVRRRIDTTTTTTTNERERERERETSLSCCVRPRLGRTPGRSPSRSPPTRRSRAGNGRTR